MIISIFFFFWVCVGGGGLTIRVCVAEMAWSISTRHIQILYMTCIRIQGYTYSNTHKIRSLLYTKSYYTVLQAK